MGGIFPGHKEKRRLCFYTNKDSSLIVFIMPVRVHVQVFLRGGFPLKQHEMPYLSNVDSKQFRKPVASTGRDGKALVVVKYSGYCDLI